MDTNSIIKKLHPLERKVLPALKDNSTSKEIELATQLKDIEVMRALQWLSNKQIITLSSKEEELIELDVNGKSYVKNGFPEKKLLQALSKPLTMQDAMNESNLSKEEFSISLGTLKKQSAIAITKDKDIMLKILPAGKKLLNETSPEEEFLQTLPKASNTLTEDDSKIVESLLRRKNIIKKSITKTVSAKLTELGNKLIKTKIQSDGIVDTLTSKMLKEHSWKGKNFREYDVTINVPKIYGAKRHIVSQAIEYIKKIWIEMGFEQQTDSFIQTAFWDLDALYVPQDHPAREMQDTFFIKDPDSGKLPALSKKVKAAHVSGGDTGSKGWRTDWQESNAKKNLLITHDTFLSAKVLASLSKKDIPKKTFQVMKVFRNEVLDWKHLFEFNQIGGIVIDENANFRNLLGYLKQFFRKMGYEKIRMRPAHFPYTEPSCEIEVFHPIKKQWIELGGSGIFRPELVKPLLGIEVPVLAWGLGLERILTDYYQITDLRNIYKNDIKQLKEFKMFMK